MKKLLLLFIALTLSIYLLSSCHSQRTEQEIIAEYIQDRFFEIDQLRDGRKLSLDEAEAYLYCWAFDGGFDYISHDELREAISVVLECNDEVRNLIYGIDDIDLDDYR